MASHQPTKTTDQPHQAYGELAFGHIPRSYILPEQYWVWRGHMLQVLRSLIQSFHTPPAALPTHHTHLLIPNLEPL
jgi:hypothetical protein